VTAAEVIAAVRAAVPETPAAADAFETVTVDVPAERWVAAATAMRDAPASGCDFFDWLSAYDAGDAGLAVVARVWSVAARHGVILRTHVARDGGGLASLTEVWAGAGWHERETHEMFGIGFDGHPGLTPLLLPEGFEGSPLRKEFVLASRVAKDWPGRKEPGESDADRRTGTGATPGRRRAIRPPGVPAPGTWGPQP
jgi:NADH-quinone oxidoreductase subunit C